MALQKHYLEMGAALLFKKSTVVHGKRPSRLKRKLLLLNFCAQIVSLRDSLRPGDRQYLPTNVRLAIVYHLASKLLLIVQQLSELKKAT